MIKLGPLVLLLIVAAIVYAAMRARRAAVSGVPGSDSGERPPGPFMEAAEPAPRVSHTPRRDVEDDLGRWVAAGLLGENAAAAILAYETAPAAVVAPTPAPAARRIPAVAEALGYLGGILAMVGLGLLVAQYWPDMATGGRLALCAAGAVGFLAAGAVVREKADPALARLRGFLWLASAAATVLFTGIMMRDGFGVTENKTVVLAGAGVVAMHSGLLWWRRERPLQQLVFLGAGVVLVGAFVSEFASDGPVGLVVWFAGAAYVLAGVRRVRPLSLLTETIGALAVVVGATITASGWQAFGLPFAVLSAFGLLSLAAIPGLAPGRAEQRIAALIGGVALLQTGPGAIGYFAQDAGVATGIAVWTVGIVVMLVGARRLVRAPVVVETFGGFAIVGGAALTGVQWHGFAPIFGIVTAVGLVALGMLPGRVLMSVFGSLGLLVNVPWAIGWYFPGEGRAPLLIMISGALILGVAVMMTRMRGRFRTEFGSHEPVRHRRGPHPPGLSPLGT